MLSKKILALFCLLNITYSIFAQQQAYQGIDIEKKDRPVAIKNDHRRKSWTA